MKKWETENLSNLSWDAHVLKWQPSFTLSSLTPCSTYAPNTWLFPEVLIQSRAKGGGRVLAPISVSWVLQGQVSAAHSSIAGGKSATQGDQGGKSIRIQDLLVKKALPQSFPYLVTTADMIFICVIIVINLSGLHTRKPRLTWVNELPKTTRQIGPELEVSKSSLVIFPLCS